MPVFSRAQFGHLRTSHVVGPHGFPDTGEDPADEFRPLGPNVSEDTDPKHYASPLIAKSDDYKKRMYHGESWDTPESDEFEMPSHATYGHTVRHMSPR